MLQAKAVHPISHKKQLREVWYLVLFYVSWWPGTDHALDSILLPAKIFISYFLCADQVQNKTKTWFVFVIYEKHFGHRVEVTQLNLRLTRPTP